MSAPVKQAQSELPKIDAKWQCLPPESQEALYPLLRKKRLTGRDIGRISMFNAIAAFNGHRALDEINIQDLVANMTESGWRIYNIYTNAFFTLENYKNLVASCVEIIDVICKLLNINVENALHANVHYSDCAANKYNIKELSDLNKNKNSALEFHNTQNEIWLKGKNAINNCAMERFKFKIAGEVLKVPGLEAILNKEFAELKKILADHHKSFQKARESFQKLDLPKDTEWLALDWTQPLPDVDSITVPQKTMKEARQKLNLNSFVYDYNFLDEIFKPFFI